MAKLGCAVHQQLLQPRWRTMSRTAAGFCCEGIAQLQISCYSSRYRIPTASHGGNVTSMMIQPRRLQSVGLETNGLPWSRRRSLTPASSSSCCLANKVATSSKTREEDFGSVTRSAGFTDRGGDISEWSEEEVSVVGSDNLAVTAKNQWRFELGSLIRGHVGRFAFLAILFLGVGVNCLTNVWDAEAATTSHINSLSNGGLDGDMRSLALGPEGPLLEEFWDNMRRYGLYFLTVVTGGVYQLVKPAVDALRNPVTAILIIVIVTGSIYLVGLTVSAMLGINEFHYDYAV